MSTERQGEPREARRLFDEAVALFRDTGDTIGLALALGRERDLQPSAGDTADAR